MLGVVNLACETVGCQVLARQWLLNHPLSRLVPQVTPFEARGLQDKSAGRTYVVYVLGMELTESKKLQGSHVPYFS